MTESERIEKVVELFKNADGDGRVEIAMFVCRNNTFYDKIMAYDGIPDEMRFLLRMYRYYHERGLF